MEAASLFNEDDFLLRDTNVLTNGRAWLRLRADKCDSIVLIKSAVFMSKNQILQHLMGDSRGNFRRAKNIGINVLTQSVYVVDI